MFDSVCEHCVGEDNLPNEQAVLGGWRKMHNEELCYRGGGEEGCWWNIWETLIFIFRCFRKIVKSDCKLRHVRLFLCMGILGPHRTDFHEIYFEYFSKTC